MNWTPDLRFALALAGVLTFFMLGGCGGEVNAEELVNTKCGEACHTLSVVYDSENITEEEWAATVQSMEDKGMDVSSAERQAIIDYLAAQSAGK